MQERKVCDCYWTYDLLLNVDLLNWKKPSSKLIYKKWWKQFIGIFFLTHRPTWADAQTWVMIVFTAEERHLRPEPKPDTHLSVFGFLRISGASLSSVTQPRAKAPQEAKRDKEGPCPGASEAEQPC